jgi:hypothetical protein
MGSVQDTAPEDQIRWRRTSKNGTSANQNTSSFSAREANRERASSMKRSM